MIGAAAGAAPPERVVSVNLCTDQLALRLAAPGQLVSVSKLAHDADSSAMWEAAQQLPANGSGAEEVYLLNPDLVLAGTFTSDATVSMLRGLGIRVEQFAPASSLDDIPRLIRQMGAALAVPGRADALIDTFERELTALRSPRDSDVQRPRAALFYVNSYTSGTRTLAGDILTAAGFVNIAAEAGLDYGGTLPLEQLVMLRPDVVIAGRNYPGQARAEDNLDHPALHALRGSVMGQLVDRDWICGTPDVLTALRDMAALRQRWQAAQ